MRNHESILGPGDLFFIPQNTTYERSPVDGELCKMFYCHFTLDGTMTEIDPNRVEEDVSDSLRHLLLEPSQIDDYEAFPPGRMEKKTFSFLLSELLQDDQNEMIPLCYKLMARNQRVSSVLAAQSSDLLLLQILSEMSLSTIRNYSEGLLDKERKEPSSDISKAITYIHSHYREKITLEMLCKVTFMSKQMLIRHFRQETGKTPITYLTDLRLNLSKQMLQVNREANIKEVCAEFGFEDQCYFSRMFRKYTGLSPSEFRDKVWDYDEKRAAQ